MNYEIFSAVNGRKAPRSPKLASSLWATSLIRLTITRVFRDEKFYRDEYAKALPYLQIMSSGRPFHQVDEDEVEVLRQEVSALKAIAETRKESDAIMDKLFTDPEFKELLKQKLKDIKP